MIQFPACCANFKKKPAQTEAQEQGAVELLALLALSLSAVEVKVKAVKGVG